MSAERFPLDFDALNRGDYLSAEAVEKATLARRSDDGFWHKVLRLKEMIRDHFESRGEIVTVRSEGDGLRILVHTEQAEYAQDRERRAIKQVLISRKEAQGVDVLQLGDEQRERFERWKHRNAFRTQQMLKPPPPRLE